MMLWPAAVVKHSVFRSVTVEGVCFSGLFKHLSVRLFVVWTDWLWAGENVDQIIPVVQLTLLKVQYQLSKPGT